MSMAVAGGTEKELCVGTIDLQINGAFGVDFASPALTLEQLENCCTLLRQEGVSAILATIITDTIPNLCRALQHLNVLRSQSSLIADVIQGFHVEGPFLSDQPGFVGAHDPQRTAEATIDAAESLFEAASGRLRLVTLAPERDRRGEVTKWFTGQGVVVSIGHSNASLEELDQAIRSGASLVTHYGNGCPLQLARHDNILQRLLYFADALTFTMIADGVHLPKFFLENLLRVIGQDRLVVVSDAILAAGCGAGDYELAGRPIRVGVDGIPRTPDGLYLAGSGWTQRTMDHWMATELGWDQRLRYQLLVANPAKVLGI